MDLYLISKNYVQSSKYKEIEQFIDSKELFKRKLIWKRKITRLIILLIKCLDPENLFLANKPRFSCLKCKLCKNVLNINIFCYEFVADSNSITNPHRRVCESCKDLLLSFADDELIKLCEPKIIYDLWLIKETNIHKFLNLDVFYYIFKLMLNI